MRKDFALLVSLIFVFLVLPCQVSPKRGPSTREERARALQIAQRLQSDPLARELKKDREWLIRWVIDVPDIHVSICVSMLGRWYLDKGNEDYRAAITAAMIGAQTAFAMQHPDEASDSDAAYLAGMEGALNAYQAIQRQHPDYRFEEMEALLGKRADGNLPDAVRGAAKSCRRKT